MGVSRIVVMTDTRRPVMNVRWLVIPLAALILAPARAPAQQDAAPATQPSTQPAPAVAALLQRIDAAYAKLQSAQFNGRMIGHYDIAGQKSDNEVAFTSSFAAPNRFRHEAKSDVTIGSTGDKVFAYQPTRNVYAMYDAPKARAGLGEWPRVVAVMLPYQNPS